MADRNTQMLRQLHPDASETALEFHSHTIDKMVRWGAPTSMVVSFSRFTPAEPTWLQVQICVLHDRSLEVYGTYPVAGTQRCTQCLADRYLWLPAVASEGLLSDPDALFDAEFLLGESLAEMKSALRKEPNERVEMVSLTLEAVIDNLSDIRTESQQHWHRDNPDYIPGIGDSV